jgi:MFS family permease
MENIAKQEGLSSKNEDLNNKSAGIYNGFLTIGAVAAPVIGGALNVKIGYRYTNDTMAFVSLGFLIIYALFNTKLS